MPRGIDAKMHSLLSLAKRNILISPLEGEKKFLNELRELRNFREGYKSDRATECAMTNVGKVSENNLQQKQLSNLAILSPTVSYEMNNSQFTTHHSLKQKFAFTLAEVLITLGIIGIVASMTIPTLIQNYKRQVVATRLEKFYSTVNQSIKMSELTYGERDQWFEDSTDFEKNKQWFDKYIAPNMNIVKQETRNVWGAKYEFYILADGSALGIFGANLRDYRFFPLSFDKCIKSTSWRAPAEGRCVFSFYYNPKGGRYNFEPFDAALENEKDIDYSLKYHRNYGCYNKNYNGLTWPAYCTKIIQYNGWKVPKDYPYKLY